MDTVKVKVKSIEIGVRSVMLGGIQVEYKGETFVPKQLVIHSGDIITVPQVFYDRNKMDFELVAALVDEDIAGEPAPAPKAAAPEEPDEVPPAESITEFDTAEASKTDTNPTDTDEVREKLMESLKRELQATCDGLGIEYDKKHDTKAKLVDKIMKAGQ